MATKDLFARLLFQGGFATDYGPSVDISPDQSGIVQLPFLTDAENVTFEFDGGPHLVPGTAKLNSSALESGAVVKGLFDFWIMGVGGTPTQQRICHVGTKIKADAADGTFVDIKTGLTSGAVPSYAVLNDILVTVNGVNANVMYDGTTAAALTADPGVLGMVESHKNFMFGAGNPTHPSRLYYSKQLDPTDWTGSGSGTIDIETNDGDMITGLASHKDELWVFKGPYKGSIHRITGTSSSDWARLTYLKGLGAVWHNLIFRFRDDLGFVWSDGSIHSLNATADFGDFYATALSHDIATYIRDHVNLQRLKHAWAVNWSQFGFVLFCMPIDSADNMTQTMMMDYRFGSGVSSPHAVTVRWALWPAYATASGGCLANVVDSAASSKRIVMGGGSDGYVRKYGQRDRSIDGTTSIAYKVTTPYLTFATPIIKKSIRAASIGIQPKNAGSVTFSYQLDSMAAVDITMAQGGSAVLDSFVLDTDTLGGARFIDVFTDEPTGEFRSAAFQVRQNVLSQDLELHSISAMVQPGAESTQNA